MSRREEVRTEAWKHAPSGWTPRFVLETMLGWSMVRAELPGDEPVMLAVLREYEDSIGVAYGAALVELDSPKERDFLTCAMRAGFWLVVFTRDSGP